MNSQDFKNSLAVSVHEVEVFICDKDTCRFTQKFRLDFLGFNHTYIDRNRLTRWVEMRTVCALLLYLLI